MSGRVRPNATLRIERCRGCGTAGLIQILDLGLMPSVNAFVDTAAELDAEPRWPLEVAWCSSCALVQLTTAVPPGELFREYQHLSAASASNVRHLEDLAALLIEKRMIDGDGRVLELGSNDGSLLAQFRSRGFATLGVDPARNVAELASSRGIETIPEFLSSRLAGRIVQERGRYDLVVALNVVAHTPEVNDLLAAVEHLLAPGGSFVMEAVDVFQTLLRGQFDTIYHEHVYCFSYTSLRLLLERAGLTAVEVERIPTQGGSLRVYVRRASEAPQRGPSVDALTRDEERRGVLLGATYAEVGTQAARFRPQFVAEIRRLKERYGRVVGLGAPARGVVLMNFSNVGPDLVDMVVDDTPLKQGRLMPGTHVPVTSWDALRADGVPRAYVLLSWNYEQDLLQRLVRTVSWAEVIVPLPQLRVRRIGSAQSRA